MRWFWCHRCSLIFWEVAVISFIFRVCSNKLHSLCSLLVEFDFWLSQIQGNSYMAAKKNHISIRYWDSGVGIKTSHRLELYASVLHKTSYKLQGIARLFKNFTLGKPTVFWGEQKSPALYYFLLAIQAMKLFNQSEHKFGFKLWRIWKWLVYLHEFTSPWACFKRLLPGRNIHGVPTKRCFL